MNIALPPSDGTDPAIFKLPDGTEIRMGCLFPGPQNRLYAGVPQWADKMPLVDEDDWQEVDLMNAYGRQRNQNPQSSCTGHATAGGMSVAWALSGQTPIQFSAGYCYAYCNGNRDNGAMTGSVVRVAMDRGIPPDSVVSDHTIYTRNFPVNADAEAAKYKALEVYKVNSFKELASAHQHRFAVVYGIPLGRRFFNTGDDGIVPEFDGREVNGHAMCSAGLVRKGGQWRSKTPNSWGSNFGDNGVGYVPASYFGDLDAYAIRAVQHEAGDQLPTA